jgi:uncharacterized protein YjeT (DUF2065 family)
VSSIGGANLMLLFSGLLVIAFGSYLLGLALLTLVDAPRAERFLNLFASSPRAHILEQSLRLVVGISLVIFSEAMWFSNLFWIFGWIIAVSAVGLLFIPWRWHHQFAEWVVPMAVRHLRWFGIAALAMGTLVLGAATRIMFG